MPGRIITLLLAAGLAWAGWTAWQPPQVSAGMRPLHVALPERPGDASELWRVVTRRLIVSSAADALGKSMRERGLPAIPLQHEEQVELHAFDDPRLFDTREAAVAARDEWRKAGFDAELIKPDDRFGVALGRLYMAAYAQQLERQLQQSGRPFTYHRKELSITTWRFTFPPGPYSEQQALWLQVQAMGTADPVMMRESRFVLMFGPDAAVRVPN